MSSETITYRIDETLETDVLVIGSGLAGICAAIQAARLGCDVMLLEKDPVLGGNSGPLLGIHPSGAHSFHPYASETGIIGEIEEEAAWRHAKIRTFGHHYNIAPQWDSLLQWMCEEAGVQVGRRHYAKTAVMSRGGPPCQPAEGKGGPPCQPAEGKGGLPLAEIRNPKSEIRNPKIAAVIVEDLATFETKRINVRVAVVDGSGDGQVAKEAGAAFRMGREAQGEFGERSAPPEADHVTLGTSVTALVRKARQPVRFVPPPGTPPYEIGYGFGKDRLEDCLFAHSSWHPGDEFCFLWHTETGGQGNTIDDEHEIYDELLKQLYSAWNHIKNEAHIEEARNWELIWVSPKAGKRESRRFLGDHVLTQQDVENGIAFPDAVGYGGYSVDIHNPTGVRNTQVEIVFYSVPPLWSVPYRCLYSANVDNLFLVGRLASVTHLGLGSWRLQKTLATGGQAVGVAAALCRKYACTPREVYECYLPELQQTLLKEDATILTVPNRDPADLARQATATATSETPHGVTEETVAQASCLHSTVTQTSCLHNTDWLPLDVTRGVLLWDWAERLEAVDLYLLNEGNTAIIVPLSLALFQAPQRWKEAHSRQSFPYEAVVNRMEWGADNTVAKFRPVAVSSAEVPPHFVGWVRFAFAEALIPKDPTSDEDRYALTLPPTPGLSWARSARRYDFARRIWAAPGDAAYQSDGDSHLFRLTPAPPYGEAANVLNGWNRRFCTDPVNMWLSRPGEPLPQSLTLTWPEPQTFNTVHLVFDTLGRTYREMPFNCDQEVSPMCVKDYLVEVETADGWRTVAAETDNYRRRRVHTFARVTAARLRLTVQSVHDPAYTARVYEVRVYCDT